MNPKSKIPEPMKKPILLYLTTLALTALWGGAARPGRLRRKARPTCRNTS